jgi:hypothetical protein
MICQHHITHAYALDPPEYFLSAKQVCITRAFECCTQRPVVAVHLTVPQAALILLCELPIKMMLRPCAMHGYFIPSLRHEQHVLSNVFCQGINRSTHNSSCSPLVLRYNPGDRRAWQLHFLQATSRGRLETQAGGVNHITHPRGHSFTYLMC